MKTTINITQLPVVAATGNPTLKRLFTRLSAIALLCICQPICGQVEGLEYSVSNGEVTITGYTGTATELVIPAEIENLPVTIIANSAFAYCGDLTYVSLPDTLTNLESLAFRGCTNLIEISIPASVKVIGIAPFLECTNLTRILVEEGNTAFRSVDGVLYDFPMEILIQVPPTRSGEYLVPNTVTAIRACAFQYCSEITNVVLPDSITAIKDGTFAHCSKLTDMNIPDPVTWIGEGAFNQCSNLLNVKFPDSLIRIHDGAFANCLRLASVSIPDSVTVIGHGAFLNCASLTSVAIPASVTEIQSNSFAGCTSLIQFLVGEENLKYTSVDGVLFDKSMETLLQYPLGRSGGYIIPDSITDIDDGTFEGCTNLTSITIPNSVTYMGNGVFAGCASLTRVTIHFGPNIEIYGKPFENCPSLTSIYCLGEPPVSYVYDSYGCFLRPFNWAIGPFTVYYIEGMPGWDQAPNTVTVAPFDPDWLWGKYEFVEVASGTYVYTGDWLGWLEVSYSPWVWHYGTANWIYIKEPVAAANCGWVYMPDISTGAPELWLTMLPDCCYGYSAGLNRWLYVSAEVSANHAGWVFML